MFRSDLHFVFLIWFFAITVDRLTLVIVHKQSVHHGLCLSNFRFENRWSRNLLSTCLKLATRTVCLRLGALPRTESRTRPRQSLLLRLRILSLRRKAFLSSSEFKRRRTYQRNLHQDRFIRGEFSRLVTELSETDPEAFLDTSEWNGLLLIKSWNASENE